MVVFAVTRDGVSLYRRGVMALAYVGSYAGWHEALAVAVAAGWTVGYLDWRVRG